MTTQEMKEYQKNGYTPDQIEEIRLGLEAGLDIEPYENKAFFALQMRQIRLGLEAELPVEVYARKDYDWFQMEEIRLGLSENINVRLYAYPKVSYQTMRQMRLALLDGINLAKYVNLPAGTLKELRKALVSNVNLAPYIELRYDTEQLEQIRLCLESNIDIDKYLNPDYRGIAIRQIRIGLERNLDVSRYASLEYNWRQMREIRKGMEHQIDVSVYLNPLYDFHQMREIRLGLEDGLDVSRYSSLMYPASDMAVRRARLIAGVNDESQYGFDHIEVIEYNNLEIQITPDEMTAYVQVKGGLAGVTKSVIKDMLEEQGITKGIDEEAIKQILSGTAGSQPIVIARGKAAEPGPDGYYEYFFRTEIKREPKVLEDGSLDYRDIDWFEQVKRGQKLAVYHDADFGDAGYTVTGREFPAIKGKQLSILYGKGFYVEQDRKTYVANVDGIVELDGTTMNVSNLLTLSDVTAYMGDVRFDGNVHVTGTIGNGCTIIARDDIIVDGFVEGAVLEAGGNIILRRGVNAQNKGHIRAAGNIEGSFFESTTVYAGDSIKVNYCLNSTVECDGVLKVAGKKGSILGGVTYAGKEVNVNHVGNQVGVKTWIKLGTSTEIIRRQINLGNKLKDVDKELSVLEQAYEDMTVKYSADERSEMEIFRKIEDALYTKKEERKEIVLEQEEVNLKILQYNSAKAVMHGNVYEGVVVEINGKRWISTGVRNVTIKKQDNGVEMVMN